MSGTGDEGDEDLKLAVAEVRRHRATKSRITIEPGKMGGAPCIRGLRIPVVTVARAVHGGVSVAELIDWYPDLDAEDIAAAVDYAVTHRLLGGA